MSHTVDNYDLGLAITMPTFRGCRVELTTVRYPQIDSPRLDIRLVCTIDCDPNFIWTQLISLMDVHDDASFQRCVVIIVRKAWEQYALSKVREAKCKPL